MNKGEKTKRNIIKQSALLLNEKGYISTSLSEILAVTGVQKGGLYNHFKEKEELLVHAFDYCCDVLNIYLEDALEGKITAKERLRAHINAYCSLNDNVLPGGCPIVNVTIQVNDGASDKLQHRSQEAMQLLVERVTGMIQGGIEKKEFLTDVDARKAATMIISAIEGGLIVSKALKDETYVQSIKEDLFHFIEQL